MNKKLLIPLLFALLMCFGCAKEADKMTSCQDIAEKVRAAAPFQELTAMTDKYIGKYLMLDTSVFEEAVMLRDATRATPEMILIVRVLDQKDVKSAQDALQAFQDEQLIEYRDYQPLQMPKVEAARVLTKGRTLALIVSPDAALSDAALEKEW